MLSVIISGGQVLDGTGRAAVAADVGVAAGRIAAVGDLSGAASRVTIPAAGRIVCPGFIDAHSHSDTYLLIEPAARSKILQGITTEVVGNCGASAAPLSGTAHMPSDWRDKSYPGTWRTVAEYRELLARVQPAVNVVLLVGHNTLRSGVVGHEARAVTRDELGRMQALLEQALAEGARGLSTGLIYAPGRFAATEEIAALAAVAGRRGGIYSSHMRSEGPHLLAAIDEALAIGRQAGVRVQISHLKTSGRANWQLCDEALARLRQARAEGLVVAADRYPYTSACTDLDVIFPEWAAAGGHAAIMARLRDPDVRQRLRAEILAARTEAYWDTVVIGSTHHPDSARFRGRPLREAAQALGLAPVDAVLYLVERDELRTSAFFFGMSEENLWKILAEPYVMLGTDASVRGPDGPLAADYPHPRAYGSFPRFLRAVLDGRSVALPEAIRKLTSLPAGQFGLDDRGVLAVGQVADLVVFDPARVRDKATYDQPHQLAEGIETVVVNGAVAVRDGRLTGVRAGAFL